MFEVGLGGVELNIVAIIPLNPWAEIIYTFLISIFLTWNVFQNLKSLQYLRQSSGSLTLNAELSKMQLRGKIRSSMLIPLKHNDWLFRKLEQCSHQFFLSFIISSFLCTKKKVSCLTIFPVSFQFATIGVVAFSLDLLLLVFIRWLSAFYRGCISFQFYFQFIYLCWILFHIIIDCYVLIIDTFLIISVYHCLPLHND